MDNPKCISILKGHTAAVTCIRWKTSSFGELIISSSDDR